MNLIVVDESSKFKLRLFCGAFYSS